MPVAKSKSPAKRPARKTAAKKPAIKKLTVTLDVDGLFEKLTEKYGRAAVLQSLQGARFVKLDAKGRDLPASAADFDAVRDNHLGLIWSRMIGSKSVNQADAQKLCAAHSFGGEKGGRLPTRAELISLVDDTRYSPAIDIGFFPETKSDWYWTGTSWASSPDCAWVVHFYGGSSDGYHRLNGAFVRAVRAVPGQSSAFVRGEA